MLESIPDKADACPMTLRDSVMRGAHNTSIPLRLGEVLRAALIVCRALGLEFCIVKTLALQQVQTCRWCV